MLPAVSSESLRSFGRGTICLVRASGVILFFALPASLRFQILPSSTPGVSARQISWYSFMIPGIGVAPTVSSRTVTVSNVSFGSVVVQASLSVTRTGGSQSASATTRISGLPLEDSGIHSVRNARIGSRVAARRAGTTAARNAAKASVALVINRIRGS